MGRASTRKRERRRNGMHVAPTDYLPRSEQGTTILPRSAPLISTERCPGCGGSEVDVFYQTYSVLSVDVATGQITSMITSADGAPRIVGVYCRTCDYDEWPNDRNSPFYEAAYHVGDNGKWPATCEVD